ncbi:MAG: prephenate dehydrogenase/arogenate dehydrogenase family protein, partial [Methylotenera sp.]|nr:prephenate dehydrogenase/arogenate dehydrogenase family protein [Methylotenera sp.]
ATESTLKAIRHLVNPGVLFMDVGSTKCDVIEASRRALGERAASFVPCHPIAGKESGGVQHAEATLYEGRQVILTPQPFTNPALVQRATDVWSALGATVLKMRPHNHDAAFAAVSHLPHLLAFAYFQAIAEQPAARDYLSLAGPGFRDFTRIAAGEPAVWRDILLANKHEVLAQSKRFRTTLDQLEALIEAGDAAALEAALRPIAEGREAWSLPSPAVPPGRSTAK